MSELMISTERYFGQDIVKRKMNELLNENSASFITSVLQTVQGNEMLAKADPATVFNAACTAAVMKLPISNNLGYAYIVPYNASKKINGNWEKRVEAQFQIGAKGFIQLAQRSGLYKKISYATVCEGQLLSADPLKGYEFDWTVESDKVIGYVAYFELTNGFEAYLYMSIKQIDAHAIKFSQSYAYDKKDSKNTSNWSKNFDAMALKTVIKLLLSKFGPLSIEMQTAIAADQTVVDDENASKFRYVDQVSETQVIEKKQLPELTDEEFNPKLVKWQGAIDAGKTTDYVLAFAQSRYSLSLAQVLKINELKKGVEHATA